MYRIFLLAFVLSLFGSFDTGSGLLATAVSVHSVQEQEPEPDAEMDEARDGEPNPRKLEVEQLSIQLTDEAEMGIPRAQRNGIRGERSVINNNGVTTTTANDSQREITIIETPPSAIVVNITRRYGPDDIDRLRKMHPELVDYVEMFPKQAGDHEVELNLAIKSVYRAANPQQLKQLHPEVFAVYQRYRSKR